MMALAYTIAGVLTFVGMAVAAGAVVGLWFVMSGVRPDLMERDRSSGPPT